MRTEAGEELEAHYYELLHLEPGAWREHPASAGPEPAQRSYPQRTATARSRVLGVGVNTKAEQGPGERARAEGEG